MVDVAGSHVLDTGDGLTGRAIDFLRDGATRTGAGLSASTNDQIAAVAAKLELPKREVSEKILRMQTRFWGLRYRSFAWSFDEVITFAPALDADDDDGPVVSLVEHGVAHPFGVWAALDGAVSYMFPTVGGGKFIRVFDRCESIIEADALYAECRRWDVVASGGFESVDDVEESCSVLPRLDEASGPTEAWWQGEDFRVHIWRTWAAVFERESLTRWSVWADVSRKTDEAVTSFLR